MSRRTDLGSRRRAVARPVMDVGLVFNFCTSRIRSGVSTSTMSRGLSKVMVISALMRSPLSSLRALATTRFAYPSNPSVLIFNFIWALSFSKFALFVQKALQHFLVTYKGGSFFSACVMSVVLSVVIVVAEHSCVVCGKKGRIDECQVVFDDC